jgi:hypothetical protein
LVLSVYEREALTALAGLGAPIATTDYDTLIEQVTGGRPLTRRDDAEVQWVLRE